MLDIQIDKSNLIVQAKGSHGLMVSELTCAVDKIVTEVAKGHDSLTRDDILEMMYSSLVEQWAKEDEKENGEQSDNLSDSLSDTGDNR